MPTICIANHLAFDEVPECIRVLNPMELRLISTVITFQTVVVLDQGQRAARGMAISFPCDPGATVQQLPRPINDSGIIVVRINKKARRAQPGAGDGGTGAGNVEAETPQSENQSASRLFNVRRPLLVEAIRWLQANNPFYANVELREETPEEAAAAAAAEATEQEMDDMENIDPNELVHYTMMAADPCPRRGTAARLAGAKSRGKGRGRGRGGQAAFTLQEINAAPLSFYIEPGLEAQANVFIYPRGRNHWGTDRHGCDRQLYYNQYMRQRMMNADRRCHHPAYMGWAVSSLQHKQLCGAVGVAVRWRHGSMTNGEVREMARAEVDPTTAAHILGRLADTTVELSDRCWAYMKNIRGTAAYWQSAGSDLFAIIRSQGCPTWFMTFSADDSGWDDLALALASRNGVEFQDDAAKEEYLKNLSGELCCFVSILESLAALLPLLLQ